MVIVAYKNCDPLRIELDNSNAVMIVWDALHKHELTILPGAILKSIHMYTLYRKINQDCT